MEAVDYGTDVEAAVVVDVGTVALAVAVVLEVLEALRTGQTVLDARTTAGGLVLVEVGDRAA